MILEQENRLLIGQESIPFAVAKGKPHRIRISFTDKNEVRMETHTGRLETADRQFLQKKYPWILKNFRIQQQRLARKHQFLHNLDQEVLLLGKTVPIHYQAAARTGSHVDPSGKIVLLGPAHPHPQARKEMLAKALKSFSKRFLEQKVDAWAEICGLSFNQLRVKDVKSKWGSCSSKQNINLNWQLIFLEEPLIEYVIVHELMHLREMNHSPRFWKWVETYFPDYKKARKILNDRSWLIGIMK